MVLSFIWSTWPSEINFSEAKSAVRSCDRMLMQRLQNSELFIKQLVTI